MSAITSKTRVSQLTDGVGFEGAVNLFGSDCLHLRIGDILYNLWRKNLNIHDSCLSNLFCLLYGISVQKLDGRRCLLMRRCPLAMSELAELPHYRQ